MAQRTARGSARTICTAPCIRVPLDSRQQCFAPMGTHAPRRRRRARHVSFRHRADALGPFAVGVDMCVGTGIDSTPGAGGTGIPAPAAASSDLPGSPRIDSSPGIGSAPGPERASNCESRSCSEEISDGLHSSSRSMFCTDGLAARASACGVIRTVLRFVRIRRRHRCAYASGLSTTTYLPTSLFTLAGRSAIFMRVRARRRAPCSWASSPAA